MEQDDQSQISNLPDLESLRERLEQQEAAKLKAEQIVSTLSRIKAREKASRRRLPSRDDPSVISSSERKSSSAVKEKSNLLKRKLEEDRAKFESQRGSDSFDKVNEVVETIKAQLEDREKLTQTLLLAAQQQQIENDFIKGSDGDNRSAIEPPSEPEVPDEIKQKIADLEAKIIDLQENLKEKDEVISARTQAITLLSEDMSRKSKTTLDTLEETQEQMRQMQNNFILIEDKMKKEHQRLKEEAEDKKQRCLQAEKNLRIVEATRFDLSTRVAELQEKVVGLQTKNIELEKSIAETESKQNELKDALEASKNTSAKVKAQFKIKMKTLEEECNMLKKTTDDGNAVSSFQERIAELEEEKEQCRLLKERVSELEQKLSQQGDDLDSHVKAMSKLELEKLDLIQVVQERNGLLSDKDSLIYQLQQQLAEAEQLKVSAEMRSIELEEKLDAAISDKKIVDSDNEIDITNLKQQLIDQEEIIKELQYKLSARQNEMIQGGGDGVVVTDLSSELEEWKNKYFEMESRYNKVNELYSAFESRVYQAEKQNEDIVIKCNNLRTTVTHLQSVMSLEKSSQEGASRDESTSGSSLIKGCENDKDIEINRLREELAVTTAELHKLSEALNSVNITAQQVDELNKHIVEKDKELTNISNELEKRTRKLSDYKKFHKLKSEDVIRVSHELETVTSNSQEKISELERDIENARQRESELQKKVMELKESQTTDQAPVSDQTQKMKKLLANLKLKTKTCKDLEGKVVEYEKKLESNANLLQEVIGKESSYLQEISELKSQLNEFQSLSIKSSQDEETTLKASDILEAVLVEKDNLNSKIFDQQQLICQLENEIKMLKDERESAFSQLEKIQENEFSKNDELFKMLECQVSESKNEVQYLQEQLTDIASKYEQAWAKLQEKEAYIESIEAELLKAQEKLRSIESNTEEMAQRFKEKSEIFSDRLNRAENANIEFEKYRNDIEQKFANSAENELLLRNSLTDKTAENEELKRIVNDFSNRNEWFEKETNNMKSYIVNLENEITNLRLVKDAHNHTLEEVEKLNNEIKQLKLMNERTVAELKEREKIAVESLENELKSLVDKCNAVENERYHLSKEFENIQQENQILKEEMERLKIDFESRYSFLQSEKNHYEELYSKLKTEITAKEENFGAISESQSKEVEAIMYEQRVLVENLHAEFKEKEQSYFAKLREQEEYKTKLQESLQTIEKNAESLKFELSNVGLELASSKEELMSLRQDQDKTVYLKNKLEKIKEDYCQQLEEQQEHVRMLQVELLREKAKKEIDNVVKEAEIKVDSMAQRQQAESNPPLFKFSGSDQDDVANSFDVISQPSPFLQDQDIDNKNEVVNVNILKEQLTSVMKENERLLSIVNEYESSKKSVEAELIPRVEPNLFSSCSARIENKDEEDGWGWSGEEVAEQETAFSVGVISDQQYNSPQQVDFKMSLMKLEQKLQLTEAENSRLTEDLKASQIRCSKLVKKAKELKVKNDGLERGSREKSVGFEDLDFAMQEELRGRIETLEKNLQEALNENKNWKIEKENYVRKIDTLTSGNERLVDMKERQDIELSIFQKQNADLKQQILAFEWKVEELMEDHEKLTVNRAEMEEKINSLAVENEQLIKIVGDMKDQQKSSTVQEQSHVNVQESNPNPMFTLFRDDPINELQKMKESKYDSLLQNYERLSNEKNDIDAVNNELRVKVDTFNARIIELEIENFDLKNKLDNFQASSDAETSQVSQLLKNNEELIQTIKIKEEKLTELQNVNVNLEESLSSLQNCVSSLEDQNRVTTEDLGNKNKNILKELNLVKDELEKVKKEKDELNKKSRLVEIEKQKEESTNEPSAIMFRGFADDNLSSDSFDVPKENVEKENPDLPKYKKWENIELTKNESSNSVSELKEQVLSLTTLLQDKEMELELLKQTLDNRRLQSENLLDVWSEKFEDLKIEQSSANSDHLDVCTHVLNAAEKKYNEKLLLKDEEIAHLTCELSSSEQQLANAKKEFGIVESELNAVIEKYKIENESLQKALSAIREECIKLEEQLEETSKNERDSVAKLNDVELKLQSLQIEYDKCLRTIADESQIRVNLEQNYSMCSHYLEEKERIILDKERLLEAANIKIEKLNDALRLQQSNNSLNNAPVGVTATEELQKQPTLEIPISASPSSESPTVAPNEDSNKGIDMNEHVIKFKEMIKQRDIEIERLMEALGESEERLIKAEEMRLSREEEKGLKLTLDEALYTLHLRDVRCEELTLELMQLLEERDTLQLRLSTAIRMNEELRRKSASSSAIVPSEPIVVATNSSSSCTTRTSSIEHNQSSSDQEMTQSDSESGRIDRLNEKLGELHSIGYQRDLSLHQDRLKRHNEQMHLYSPSNSPQQQSTAQPSTNVEDANTSGGFLSWIFGGSGSSNNAQMDV